MLRNINDYLSLFALIILVIISLRLLIGSFFNFRASKSVLDRVRMVIDYQDNEEE